MKYYVMSQDKRIKNPVVFKDFQTDENIELHASDHEWLRDNIILQTLEDENSIYTDIYEAHLRW